MPHNFQVDLGRPNLLLRRPVERLNLMRPYGIRALSPPDLSRTAPGPPGPRLAISHLYEWRVRVEGGKIV